MLLKLLLSWWKIRSKLCGKLSWDWWEDLENFFLIKCYHPWGKIPFTPFGLSISNNSNNFKSWHNCITKWPYNPSPFSRPFSSFLIALLQIFSHFSNSPPLSCLRYIAEDEMMKRSYNIITFSGQKKGRKFLWAQGWDTQ